MTSRPSAASARVSAEQPLRLARGQGRGRLVEDQDARRLGEALGHLDELPFGERQPPHLHVRPELREAVAAEELLGLPAQRAGVDRAEPGARLAAEPDVLLHGEVGDQRQLLEDRGDPAGLRRVGVLRPVGRAVDEDRPGVVPHRAREDLDEGRLCPRRSRRGARAPRRRAPRSARRSSATMPPNRFERPETSIRSKCAASWAAASPGVPERPVSKAQLPAASAAVISTQSGVIGRVRPGGWSLKAFLPSSILQHRGVRDRA